MCLGTLMRVPDKVKKVPRLAPECLIGCGAYDSTGDSCSHFHA